MKPHSQSPFLGARVGHLGGTCGRMLVGMVLQSKLLFLSGFPVLWDSDSICPVGSPPLLGALLEGKHADPPIHNMLSHPEDGGALDNRKGGQSIFRLSVQKNSSVQLPSG